MSQVLGVVQGALPANPALRALTGVTLTNAFGNDLSRATSTPFFTNSAGMAPAQLGLGHAIAAVYGVAARPARPRVPHPSHYGIRRPCARRNGSAIAA